MKRALSIASAALTLTACAGLKQNLVQFDHLSDCPKQTSSSIAAAESDLNPRSSTHDLSCALNYLRKTKDSSLRSGSLGSRLCLLLAERETDQGKRERLAAEGVGFAEAAIKLGGEEKGAVHYYLAANLGLAVREHIGLAMENLDRLETEMKRAMALSPDIDDGGPMRLLGMLYLKAPAWPSGIGDRDKAYELLEEAVRKHPDHPLNHLFFAQSIWDRGDENAISQVRDQYAIGLKLLQDGNWGHSKEPWKREFAEFQQEVGENYLLDETSVARAN